MSDTKRGLIFGASAYILWGFFPLYWNHLGPSGPLEILSNRVFWSLVFVAIIAFATRKWGTIRTILRDRRKVMYILAASALITVNWGLFIYGVTEGHVIETSLGYFINPLVTVLIGVVVLGERLRPVQWAAVGVGAAAVVVLTVDYGRLPYIALILASSFALYGLIKKQVNLGTVEGLTIESAFITPFALVFVVYLNFTGEATVGYNGAFHFVLIALAGVATAIPLLLFGAAATRLSMTSIGILQYFAPILQFIFGLFVFNEDMTPVRWAGFILVWIALIAFTYDGVANHRRTLARAAQGAAL